MKKALIALLASSMLLCGCSKNIENQQTSKWGAEYSVSDKYKVLLPDNISPAFTYDEVIEANGISQYGSKSKDTFPSWFQYSANAYYNTTLLGKECIIGYSFENEKINEIAYIFECSDKKQFDLLKEELYDKLVECFGESNYPPEDSNYCVTWNTYLDDYMVDLLPSNSTKDSIIVTLSLNETLTGSRSDDTYYTTTTAYEWKLNTSSDGHDWCNADETEKEVWCSNSFASWRLMGYDIPSSASQSVLKSYLDEFYKDTSNRSVDLVTATEVYAELKGIY